MNRARQRPFPRAENTQDTAIHPDDRPRVLEASVVLPGMSGPALAENLAATQPEMHVLFVSGCADRFMGQQSAVGPGTLFHEKPFTGDTLTRKVREVLDLEPVQHNG